MGKASVMFNHTTHSAAESFSAACVSARSFCENNQAILADAACAASVFVIIYGALIKLAELLLALILIIRSERPKAAALT